MGPRCCATATIVLFVTLWGSSIHSASYCGCAPVGAVCITGAECNCFSVARDICRDEGFQGVLDIRPNVPRCGNLRNDECPAGQVLIQVRCGGTITTCAEWRDHLYPDPPGVIVVPEPCRLDTDGDGVCDCEDADADGACDYCEDIDGNNECDCDGEVGYDGACACEDSNGDGECDPPGVEITASGSDYYIDTNETMPEVEFHARLKNAHGALKRAGVKYKDIWFRWHLTMTYDDHNLSFTHRVPTGPGTYDQQYGTGTWKPQWGALVAGAQTLSAHVKVGTSTGQPTAEASATGFRIKGRNPTNAQIASQASAPWYFRKIVRAESREPLIKSIVA